MAVRSHVSSNARSTIKVCQLNLGKISEAGSNLVSLVDKHHFDVALLQEPPLSSNSLAFPNTLGRVFSISIPGVRTRAMIVAINSNLSVTLHVHLSSPDIAVATLSTQSDEIVCVSAYHHGGNGNNDPNTEDLNKLQVVLDTFRNSHIILGFDANARSGLWGDHSENGRGRAVEDFISTNNLFLLNDGKRPTYVHRGTERSSFIDLTLVSQRLFQFCRDWHVSSDDSLSDHQLIFTSLDFGYRAKSSRTLCRRFNINKADWDKFDETLRENIEKSNLDSLITTANFSGDIASCAEILVTCIVSACKLSMPYKRQHPYPKQWWSPELTAQRANVGRLKRIYFRARRKGALDADIKWATYLTASYKYKELIYHSQRESFERFCTESFSKNIWGPAYHALKQGGKAFRPLRSIRRPDGTFTSNESETLETVLEAYFPEDNAINDNSHSLDVRLNVLEPPQTANDSPFTQFEVKSIVETMDNHKSPGEDLITVPILKRSLNVLLPTLTNLYNQCLSMSEFPSIFKRAITVLIPKEGGEAIENHKSVRPICLFSVIAKPLDSLMAKRMTWHLRSKNMLSDLQYGFTPQRSTVDALMPVTALLRECQHRQRHAIVISLDIAGAFDGARWHHILSAMKRRNVPANIYRLAKSYFSNRVVIAETETCRLERQQTMGCPQGSPSGPHFWSVLYDDVLRLEYPEGVRVQAFADDLLVIATSAVDQRQLCTERANTALRLIWDWSQTVDLNFNPNKSKFMRVSRGARGTPPTIQFGDSHIADVEELKILGVIFDKQLRFSRHADEVCRKAKLSLNCFVNVSRSSWGLGPEGLKIIYRCVTEPMLTYASPVWADKSTVGVITESMRQIQRIATLRICRAYSSCSDEALYILSDLKPINLRIQELNANYVASHPLCADITSDNFFGSIQREKIEQPVPYFLRIHPSNRRPTVPNTWRFDACFELLCVKHDNKLFFAYSDTSTSSISVQRLSLDCTILQANLVGIRAILVSSTERGLSAVKVSTVSDAVCSIINSFDSTNSQVADIQRLMQFCDLSIEVTREFNNSEQLNLAVLAQGHVELTFDLRPLSWVKRQTADHSIACWDRLWTSTKDGEVTRLFFPSVRSRLGVNLPLNYHLTQLLTNHGAFNEYLLSRKRSTTPLCSICRALDNVCHRIIECCALTDLRTKLSLQTGLSLFDDSDLPSLVKSCNVGFLKTFAIKSFERTSRLTGSRFVSNLTSSSTLPSTSQATSTLNVNVDLNTSRQSFIPSATCRLDGYQQYFAGHNVNGVGRGITSVITQSSSNRDQRSHRGDVLAEMALTNVTRNSEDQRYVPILENFSHLNRENFDNG